MPDAKFIKILLNNKNIKIDSISIFYETISIDLSKKYFNKSQDKYDSGFYTRPIPDTMLTESFLLKKDELFDSNIKKEGSLTRGVSVGNTQSVFVNSSLNLQLNGEIAKGLHLSATISDQNVPFQPEGNTQQIQEFDRVLIQLSHNNFKLSAGDLVLENKKNHFLKFYKNTVGGSLETYFFKKNNKNYLSNSEFTYSLAKGQFYSYFLTVNEGVQGPYLLRVEDNNQFITIIAGSEKVFLDGQLLKRGFNQDYTIDYNNSELNFTSNILITKFSRVRVEFEYANQNFNRTIIYLKQEQSIKKLNLFTHFYQEKDLRNQALLIDLSDQDKRLLASAGDDVRNLRVSSAQRAQEFNANQILYTLKDTLLAGGLQRFYERASALDTVIYIVKFSFVGEGQGDYTQGAPTSNGRLYEFVGAGKGGYLPVTVLPAPNQRQMWVAGGRYELTKKQQLSVELALSKQDANLFSRLNDSDNQAFAGLLTYSGQNLRFGQWQLSHRHSLELGQANFQGIDRFRAAEFDRDWSLNTLKTNSIERIADIDYSLNRKITLPIHTDTSRRASPTLPTSIRLKGTYRNRDGQARGYQVQAWATQQLAILRWRGYFFRMESARPTSFSEWQRIHSEVFIPTATLPFWLGYVLVQDKNSVWNTRRDSVQGTAMNFSAHKFYLQSRDTAAKESLIGAYERRQDFSPRLGELAPFSFSETYQLGLKLLGKRQAFQINGFYRSFKRQDSLSNAENSLNGRLDWSLTALKGALKVDMLLNLASSREPRREFVYVQVDAGQGTHTWRDDNADGLQQLNEFYEAINPDERLYVKFWIPTALFTPAYGNDFILRWSWQPKRVKKDASNLKRFWSAVNWLNTLQASKKVSSADFESRFLPLYAASASLLSARSSWRSQLFYNRSSPKQGVELLYFSYNQKNLLAQGFEQKSNTEWRLLLRKRLERFHFGRLSLVQSRSASASDFMKNRNYSIQQQALIPEYSYQPSSALRWQFKASWQQKLQRSTQNESEKAILRDLSLEYRRSGTEGSSLTAQMRFVQIDFAGNPNSPAAYEMLEALQPGANWVWQANWQRKILNGLRLSLIYNGRKSENNNIVHFGNVQVTAVF